MVGDEGKFSILFVLSHNYWQWTFTDKVEGAEVCIHGCSVPSEVVPSEVVPWNAVPSGRAARNAELQ